MTDREPLAVFYEPLWKVHPACRSLLASPPPGYRFVIRSGVSESVSGFLSKATVAHRMLDALNERVPLILSKSYADRYLRKPPAGTVLTYAAWHLVFRREPWVVEVPVANNFVGHGRHLGKYRHIVERVLASDCCKRILCWSKFAKETILTNFDCSVFSDKIEVVYPAVPVGTPSPAHSQRGVTLLFVGSASMAGEFEAKGGKEVVQAFKILARKYKDLQLVIRSDVPIRLLREIQDCGRVRLITGLLSRAELEELYKSASIFVMPAHYDPWGTILEAASFGLPVIATDIYAAREWVEDERTGYLLAPSRLFRYYLDDGITPTDMRERSGYDVTDWAVVGSLVERISKLVEDSVLRNRMGEAARKKVESGAFSITRRSEKLKSIFDESISRH